MKTRRLGAIGGCDARTQRLVRSGATGEAEDDAARLRARSGGGVLRFERSSGTCQKLRPGRAALRADNVCASVEHELAADQALQAGASRERAKLLLERPMK